MKFSHAMLPDYPLQESLASIRLADELGLYACYAADETWHKDLWLLFAAAAGQTHRIRLGPGVSPVTLREPTLIAAGELSDGCHHALSYTRQAYDYAVRHIRAGAERAGKDWRSLDIGAWVVFATGPDSEAAKDAARGMVGIYASSMPEEQLRRNGVDLGELKPVIAAIAAGDLARGIELTTPEIAERLSIAGTPEECLDKIQREIAPSGVNHMICAVTDRTLVKAFTGRELEDVADVNTQLRLIHDTIMPAFG